MSEESILQIQSLKIHFLTERGRVTAVDGVNMSVKPGEIVGIVGESGCGKSVMCQTIIRLLEHTDSVEYDGSILYNNRNILELPISELQQIRGGEISVIFQDPLTSLNPVYTIGNQLAETLRLHKKCSRDESKARSVELLKMTGIVDPKRCMRQYPHELSGGMQQRVMIAMALACEPKILIADEPTTALDVTIQAQILDLITDLNQKMGMAVLFITHDFSVVSEICDSVRVMYLGQIVEEASTEVLFDNPLHPYTQGLIKSIPSANESKTKMLHIIKGTVPSLFDVPKGCRFATRCEYADERCINHEPSSIEIENGHNVKCFRYNNKEEGE